MNKQPAYSLVFAFLIMTVIMIVASTSISGVTGKIRYFSELEGASQARLAAESAADLAILQVKEYGPGYEVSEDMALCLDSSGATVTTSGTATRSDCVSSGGFEVLAKAEENISGGGSSGEYFIPIPGTGTAGNSDDCSVDSPGDIDHSCNWNKVLYGESVTIPLISYDSSGNVLTPYDLGVNDWQLRMRTPCTNGSLADDCDGELRYDFLADGYSDLDGSASYFDNATGDDPVIVFWQLNYEDDDGNLVNVFPNDAVESYGYRLASNNNEIAGWSVLDYGYSTSGNYVALDASSSALNTTAYNESSADNLANISLQIDIVEPLIDSGLDVIPYLEWQLVFDSSTSDPIGDNKFQVQSTGFYSTNDKTFIFDYKVERDSVGASTSIYAISN